MNHLPCSRCGKDAYAKVALDGGYAWFGSVHDADHFVVTDRTLQEGPVCDACLDDLLRDGKAIVSWSMEDGFASPSKLGPRGATALFLRGFRQALERSEQCWETGETRGVAFRAGAARCFDGTVGPVTLPSWMAATGRLWRAFSATSDRRDNETDFEALGALYFLVTRTLFDDVKGGDLIDAAKETYEREVAIEVQLREARATHEAFVDDLASSADGRSAEAVEAEA